MAFGSSLPALRLPEITRNEARETDMNKAITEGLVLMPPPFSAGLNLWSSGNGRPGDASYQGAPNAALVTNDQDFGGCLELQKTVTTQRLRSFAQTPLRPDMYLRISAKVKAVSGNLPAVRIAAWVGDVSENNVSGVVQAGASVTLTQYGEVVTVQAIVGAGSRTGVDMAWGTAGVFAHVGLDLTGANGGVVRIDDLVVEDVTSVFIRDMIDLVDVRDYGAIGNGVANDTAAFAAADAAAAGRTILVSAGTYALPGNLTINSPIRFQGTVTQPAANRLILTRNFDLETYSTCLWRRCGRVQEGAAGAVLLQRSRHIRHVGPPRGPERAGGRGRRFRADQLFQPPRAAQRVAERGHLDRLDADDVVTSVATYSVANSTTLTGVANVANVPIGALVQATGVGREVYVQAKNIGAGTITLSQPLFGAAGTRTYTFHPLQIPAGFQRLLAAVSVRDPGCGVQLSGTVLGRDDGAGGVGVPV